MNKTKSKLTFTIILIVAISISWAEQEVRGYILIEGEKSARADSAIIELKYGVWINTTYSDSTGYYTIESPCTGIHNIRARKWSKGRLFDSGWQQVKLHFEDWVWKTLHLVPRNTAE